MKIKAHFEQNEHFGTKTKQDGHKHTSALN